MFQNHLALCGAASGGGNIEISYSTPITVSASANTNIDKPLVLAVAFGFFDAVGTGLTFVPEPHCQVLGHVLSIPSRVTWIYHCYELIKRWQNKRRL
jgi:hypothetical protein